MRNEKKWSIDHTNSSITFKVRHSMIANIKGMFKTFGANIYSLSNDFKTTEIDLWIDTTSINTGDVLRDEHLKGIDFLDSKNYKKIRFVSSSIKKIDDTSFELYGDLTIKKITKRIKLDAQLGGILTDYLGNEHAGFLITGTIQRNEWGLVLNSFVDAGGFIVGEEIKIACEIELRSPLLYEVTDRFVPAFNESGVL